MQGYKPGELVIISTGRQTGKSRLYEQFLNMRKPTLKIVKTKDTNRPYHIDTGYGGFGYDVTDVYKWCVENFGHRTNKYNNPRWYGDIRYSSGNFQFRDEKDAAWFMLRWA